MSGSVIHADLSGSAEDRDRPRGRGHVRHTHKDGAVDQIAAAIYKSSIALKLDDRRIRTTTRWRWNVVEAGDPRVTKGIWRVAITSELQECHGRREEYLAQNCCAGRNILDGQSDLIVAGESEDDVAALGNRGLSRQAQLTFDEVGGGVGVELLKGWLHFRERSGDHDPHDQDGDQELNHAEAAGWIFRSHFQRNSLSRTSDT